MRKAIIVGAYGCGNKGDDAILEGMLEKLKYNYRVIVLSGKYGGIKETFGVKTIKCRMNEGFSVPVLISLVGFMVQFIYNVISTDIVIIGGGSLLHDLTSYNLPFFFMLQTITKFFRKKVYYLGVGAGPISTKRGKSRCRKYLNRADGIYIRDIPDEKLLKRIGVFNVKLIADIAFLVKTDKELSLDLLKEKNLQVGKYIVMTACEWFKSDNFWKKKSMNFDKERKVLIEGMRRIIKETGLPIVFLPTVYHDYNLAVELKKYFNKDQFIIIEHNYNCRIMASIISNSSILFGMRMHSIIFAIRAGVPFIATIYDQKVKSLLKRIDGLKYAIQFEELNSDKLNNKIRKIYDNYERISNELNKSATLLYEVVKDGIKDI